MPRRNHLKRPFTTMRQWEKFQDWLSYRIWERHVNRQDNLESRAEIIEKEQGKYN